MKILIKNMAKKQINYSDLTPKELELLKDTYINLKVQSMNNNDLKEFALENISLQIKNTIGNEEEIEAWQEMEDFFKDEFINTIKNIQIKLRVKNGENDNIENNNIKLNIDDEKKDKKLDMW